MNVSSGTGCPAHPGCPGQHPESCKTVCVCECVCVCVLLECEVMCMMYCMPCMLCDVWYVLAQAEKKY